MTTIDVSQIELYKSFKNTIRVALHDFGVEHEDAVNAVAEDILLRWIVLERGVDE